MRHHQPKSNSWTTSNGCPDTVILCLQIHVLHWVYFFGLLCVNLLFWCVIRLDALPNPQPFQQPKQYSNTTNIRPHPSHQPNTIPTHHPPAHTRNRFAYAWILNFAQPSVNGPMSGAMQTLFTDPGMILSTVLVLAIQVVYVTFFSTLQRHFRPTLSQLVQEVAAGADPAPLEAALASMAAGETRGTSRCSTDFNDSISESKRVGSN